MIDIVVAAQLDLKHFVVDELEVGADLDAGQAVVYRREHIAKGVTVVQAERKVVINNAIAAGDTEIEFLAEAETAFGHEVVMACGADLGIGCDVRVDGTDGVPAVGVHIARGNEGYMDDIMQECLGNSGVGIDMDLTSIGQVVGIKGNGGTGVNLEALEEEIDIGVGLIEVEVVAAVGARQAGGVDSQREAQRGERGGVATIGKVKIGDPLVLLGKCETIVDIPVEVEVELVLVVRGDEVGHVDVGFIAEGSHVCVEGLETQVEGEEVVAHLIV